MFPKRVLFVMNGASGGSAISTVTLMNALYSRGIESAAVCHNAGTVEERQALIDATEGRVLFRPLYLSNKKIRAVLWKRPILELRQLFQTGWKYSSARAAIDFAQIHHVDLVHTNTIATPEGGFVARQLNLPHVWHLRELIGRGKPFRLPKEGRELGNYFAKHASVVVANSETSAAAVQPWLPENLLEVVPNGIDISEFKSARTFRNSGSLVIAMVANLTSQTKKHELFIKAARLLQKSGNLEFRIYGRIPKKENAYIRNLRQKVHEFHLADLFKWPGFVDPKQIMSEIDILVHPADNESFGRVAVEAMAACRPVVGVDGGGVKEIIKHEVTGFLAAPNDPASLALFIKKLIENPNLRKSMGIAGLNRAETNYSLTTHVEKILLIYERAMKLNQQFCESVSIS